MIDEVTRALKATKKSSYSLKFIDEEKRNQILLELAKQLRNSVKQIINENQKDLGLISHEEPKYDRLLLTQERIEAIAADIETVASLPHPSTKTLEQKKTCKWLNHSESFCSIRGYCYNL